MECLKGVIICEQKNVEQHIDPLKFETHNHKWERNIVGLVIALRWLDQELHEIQQKLEKTQVDEKELNGTLPTLQQNFDIVEGTLI